MHVTSLAFRRMAVRTQSIEVSPPPTTSTSLALEVERLAHVLRQQLRLEVAAHEELRRLVDVAEVFALDPHLPADRRAGAEEDGVVALL